jgi:hypothetical protein
VLILLVVRVYVTMQGSENVKKWHDWTWAVLPLNAGPSPDDSSSQPAHGTVTIIFFFSSGFQPRRITYAKKEGSGNPTNIQMSWHILLKKSKDTVFAAGLLCDGFIQFLRSLLRQSEHLDSTCLLIYRL